MGDLIFAFPVVGIDLLSQGLKAIEHGRFSNSAQLIFDLVREATVEVMLEGTIIIALELEGNMIELHHIAHDVVVLLHIKVVELMLSLGDRVIGAKSTLELSDECKPAGHLFGLVIGITGVEKV